VADLVAAWFPLAERTTQLLEGFKKEGFNVVGLETASLSTFHLFSHPGHAAGIHTLMGERALFEQILDLSAIDRIFDCLGKSGTHLRTFPVSDRLNKQVPQWSALELDLAKNVKHLTSEGSPSLFELFEKGLINVALPGFFGYQVPKVANLGLANSVDPAETLLNAVGIPREVVVDH
jgi:hypothetical protein